MRSSNNVTGTSGLALPKFWDGDADLYFSTIETIFRVRGINSEQSKLDSLLAALDIRHFRFLEHVLPDLNAQNAYSKTKSVLLQHFAPSSDDKLERLLNGSRLSDRTSPSRLLAEMRSLLGESGSQDRLLRKLFLDRLPAGVRCIIVSHPVEDLDQLAKIADRVMEENRKCTSGFGDGPEYNDYASSIGTSNVSLSTLHGTVTDLAQTVTSLTHSLQSMPHTPHNFPNTRDNNATTTSFSQRSPVARDTSPSRSSTSVRLRSFSPSPSSSGHSRSWSPLGVIAHCNRQHPHLASILALRNYIPNHRSVTFTENMAIKPDIAQATAIGELSTGMHFTAPIVHTSASSLGKLTHGSSMTPTLTLRSSSTPEAGILSYHASDQQMIQELLAIFLPPTVVK